MRITVLLTLRIPKALGNADVVPYARRRLRSRAFTVSDRDQLIRAGGGYSGTDAWAAEVTGTVEEDRLAELRAHPIVMDVRAPRPAVQDPKPVDATLYDEAWDDPPGGVTAGPPPLTGLGKVLIVPAFILGSIILLVLWPVRKAQRLYHLHLSE